MAIMEKKAFLGVQKKRLPSKHSKKKNLLNKVLDYLKSDCYLFAPLTSSSSSPSDCRSYKIGIKENDEEKKKKKLVKKVGDYLMSDCYMYAPLVVPPSSKPLGVPPKGPQRYTKYINVEVARRSILLKKSTHLANVIVKDKAHQRISSPREICSRSATFRSHGGSEACGLPKLSIDTRECSARKLGNI